ncbi:HPP family protein [Phaeobacter inhibens]|uniref:HPP family protein n=1 Tax=Phaeobacter inhibens TaxID=221822 RepID=UPI0021A709C4|nr:HPP family protein [Phaeobacter inhibens]UWR62767.1 HPP family protein [Phaeobacter inhibens]
MQERSTIGNPSDQNIIIAAIAFGLFLICARMIENRLGVTVVVGSFGAATVVMFALNGSEAAKPFSVFFGHIVSLAVGLVSRLFIHPISIDMALFVAVIGTLFGMKLFRCVHPPGGAVAMILVLSPIEDPKDSLSIALGIMMGISFYLVVVSLLPLAFRPALPDTAKQSTDTQLPNSCDGIGTDLHQKPFQTSHAVVKERPNRQA